MTKAPVLCHFKHIEAWYAHQFRTRLPPHIHAPRTRRRLSELEYEYRRLSDCPAVVALYLGNLESR